MGKKRSRKMQKTAAPLHNTCIMALLSFIELQHRTGYAKPVRYPHPCRLIAARFPEGKPQLHPRIGVNGVVDAAVVRNIAAGHAGIGSVADGIAFQRGDVALPEIQPRLDGRQVCNIGNALCGGLALQILVLRLWRSKSPETGKALRCFSCATQGQRRFNSEQRLKYSQVPATILLIWLNVILRCLRQRSFPHYNESAKEESAMFQDNLKALRKEKGITQ